jgi:asparagine synthase (glutamine-hydrolysing)
MAGFAGIVSTRSFGDGGISSQLERMVQCLLHEPRHTVDSIADNLLGVAFGWVRDPETGGALQAWNANRDVSLVLIGEQFGSDQGISRSGNGDRMYHRELDDLVRRYEDDGLEFIQTLNGSFSGLLVDLRQGKAVVFNDRYGLSRIYYHQSQEGFFFSSEAKSLLTLLPQLRRIDQQGLAEFFSLGCVLQNRSLFSGISLLPAGSFWTFHRGGRVERRRYFNPEVWERQQTLDAPTYCERLKEVLARITPRYLSANKPVGMSLTGGLDSRMILACAKPAPESLPCYTFGGPYRDCADVRIARQLARICRQPHTTIRIKDDFFEEFPALAEKTVYLTDGAMDVSGAVELYVNRRAREIAPFRVTGNYGSEILRSNVAFGPCHLDTSLFTPEFCDLLKGAAETYRSEATGHRLSFIAFKQVPWHHFSRLAVEKSQLAPRSPFLDNELVALAYQAPPELATSAQALLRVIAKGNPALGMVRTDRALRRDSFPVLTALAKAWQEFTAKAEYAYDYGMPGWLANTDRLLAGLHLERFFLGRHKFYHFRVWYRDRLRNYLRGSADSGSLPACYRSGAAGKIVREHLSGRRNHTLALHKMLSVQLIERLLVRQS